MTYKYTPYMGTTNTISNSTYLFCDEEGCRILPDNQTSSGPSPSGFDYFTSSSSAGDYKSPTPYQMDLVRARYGVGSTVSTYHTGPVGVQSTSIIGSGENSSQPTFVTSPDVDKTSVDNSALSALYSKVRGEIDLSVDIAEMGQTRKMLSDAGRLQAKILSISPKTWARRWLQLQYGWRPLASTLYESASRVVTQDYSGLTKTVGKGTGRNIVSETTDPRYNASWERSYWSRYEATFDLNASRLGNIARWTSLNPVSIAWELMPYSFVVDWFYDVGSYIRDLESAMLYGSLPLASGGKSTSTRDFRTFNFASTDSNATVTTVMVGNGTLEEVSFTRSVFAYLPLPQPPRFKASLGSSRLLSAASLLSLHLK